MEQQTQPLLSSSSSSTSSSYSVSHVRGGGGGDGGGYDAGVQLEEGDQNSEAAIPKWWEQITLRGLVVSAFLGAIFCVITHKLNLTVGIIPSLNVAAGLLGFFSVQGWTTAMSMLGFSTAPFTRQENTVIQTCIVACYGIAFSGGFGSYLLAMDENSYNLVGSSESGNRAQDVKNPALGWMTAFVFTVSFVGIFSLVPLRKIMVIDYKLIYPSGTATALLINSFHTPKGAEIARKQVKCLGKYFTISFLWSFFKWFFSGVGDSCGFDNFPTFGLQAYEKTFYFDFSTTYVGAGMICPHIVNASLLLGAILSWGILWPFIESKAGDWYSDGLGSTDFQGLYGYKVFISVSLILGDGVYNLIKILILTLKSIYASHNGTAGVALPQGNGSSEEEKEEEQRNAIFLGEGVPLWVAACGFLALAAVAIAVIPDLFPALKWYHVLACYAAAPLLAFCNAYGTGLTDWSCSSTYGKLGLFALAAWAGVNAGGVTAGLAACGVMMSIVATAADLMQDLKTGYLTSSSPRSMFVSQILGTALGCVLAPATFWMFWNAFEIGDPDGQYPAPYAVIYREMAIIGARGLSSLPSHCLALCSLFFLLALLVNLLRDSAPARFSRFVPIPMAMAIPFYIGAYVAVDMFLGSALVFFWERADGVGANTFAAAVASGLISGDGVWTIPSALLSLLGIDPPICMSFAST